MRRYQLSGKESNRTHLGYIIQVSQVRNLRNLDVYYDNAYRVYPKWIIKIHCCPVIFLHDPK